MLKNKRKKCTMKFILSTLIILLTLSIISVQASAFSLRGLHAANYAQKFLGVPYVYGGNGPNYFDCSGLTSYTYKNALGINIGRTTSDQIYKGRKVYRSELQPGDLVFPSSGHVSIYIGNNEIVHSPESGAVVKISPIYSFYTARRIVEANSSIEDITFNSNFYSKRYSDLKRIFGDNELSLGKHYLNCGKTEGRTATQLFDVKYYLNNNIDLKRAFGNDYESAYNHFLNYGYKENRILSPVFDMKYYTEHNPDVKRAFGNNYLEILKHFIDYGMKEGRQASANFNMKQYKNKYSDLQRAFGNDNKLYYDHFLIFGIYEGRTAK